MSAPSRILVVVTRRIGDVLLTTPLIRSLHRRWPEAQIDVLVFKGTEGVISANPDIHRTIVIDHRPTLGQHLSLLFRLWRSYDLSVSALPGDRPTIYARVAGKRCLGMLSRGSNQKWKQWLLSQSVDFDNLNTHTVLMNLQIADLLQIPRCYEVVSSWTEADAAIVREALTFDPAMQAYAVLHVYPMYSYKAWHRDGWVKIANWLNANHIRVVLTGGSSSHEVQFVRELKALMPGSTVDLAGKLGFPSVAYLISNARVFVGPDTAVTHIAAATGTPTVALFGPSNPAKWGPWPKNYHSKENPYQLRGTQRVKNVALVQGPGDCVPCFQEGCDRNISSLSDCLQKLPAEGVISEIDEFLARPQR